MTRKSNHVDTYHGIAAPDPYRWLEDDTSEETAAWVRAQNAVTLPYLERIPFRRQLFERIVQLNDYEKYSSPLQKGPYVFFARNSGLQNQSVLYVQRGFGGEPEVLIDPNAWSEDSTVKLAAFAPSKDARYAAYAMSPGGSEEFAALYSYSPIHNIKAGAVYPATLITTADHDDRVVPAHSFKYAAALQELASRVNPVLIRIDTRSGHGASNLIKQLETVADVYAFVMFNMNISDANRQSSVLSHRSSVSRQSTGD
jgi:prolyl oligopeptidase PreP (S9A serine peptidase family)